MGDWASANGRMITGATYYAKKGWQVLPVHGITNDGRCTCGKPHGEIKDIGKHPASSGGQTDATTDLAQIEKWWTENPDYNVGLFCKGSGLFAIDIDPRSGGDDSFEILEARSDGALPPTVEAHTGTYTVRGKAVRGRHLIYKCDPNEKFIGNFDKAGLKGIDVKHNGYILLNPSRHFSGITYEWKEGHEPWNMEPTEAPEELLAVLRAKSARKGSGSSYKEGNWDWMEDLEFAGESVDIDKILAEGLVEGQRAVEIYRLGCALANKFGTDEKGRLAIESMMIRFNHEMVHPPMELEGQNSLLMHVHRAIDFVANNPKIDRAWPGLTDWVETQGREWAEKASAKNEETTEAENSTSGIVGDAVAELVEQGMSVTEATSNANLSLPNDVDAISVEDGGRPGFRTLTDVGNGRRLVDTFGSAIRYTPGLGWFHWTGQYWHPDSEDLQIQELVKKLAPVIAGEVTNYPASDDTKRQELVSWAKKAKSNNIIAGTIKNANSDPRVVTGVERWDGDAHLLGVLNGVVDLHTGDLLEGQPDLYITKRAPVSYTPGLRNVRWEQFIDFATGGDKELQDWIQKAVGYTLTGLSNQDVLFLVYGPAGSGKNTFVETIVTALSTEQYAGKLPSETMAAGKTNDSSAQYYMAELRGKRMIWIDELPESERLNENQIKQMTGSSTITGRSPGEKPFNFKAQGKLWITTNHRPIINDDAMWRRLRPIPWTNVPDPSRSNPDLKAYLSDPEGGLPAVLSWAVEGAIKYLGSSERDPLGWCTAVREAADIYRKNEDRIGLFLDEETRELAETAVAVSSLYSVYRMWSGERGERPMTQIAFQRKLSDRGLDVTGQGAKATISNRALKPRAVPTGEVDWGNTLRAANSF